MELSKWNRTWSNVLKDSAPTSAAGRQAAPAARSLCQPQFEDGDRPLDFTRTHTFSEADMVPFEQLASEFLDNMSQQACLVCTVSPVYKN